MRRWAPRHSSIVEEVVTLQNLAQGVAIATKKVGYQVMVGIGLSIQIQ